MTRILQEIRKMARNAARNFGAIVFSTLLRGVSSASDSTATAVKPTPAGHSPPPTDGLEAWINVHAIQTLTHHTSGVLAAVILFSVVSFVVQRLMHDSWVRYCVLLIDELVLLALFIYFAYEFYLFI